MRRAFLSAAAFFVAFNAPAFAQTPDPRLGLSAEVVRQIETISADKRQRSAAENKMDSALIYAAREATGRPQFSIAPGLRLPQLSASAQTDAGGQVLVDIKTGDAAGTAEQVRLRGGTVVSSYPEFDTVQAKVDVGIVEAIAAIPAVTSIRPASPAYPNRIDPPPSSEKRGAKVREQLARALGNSDAAATVGKGPNKSEAIVAHGADAVQNVGITGSGIKICVISDGVDTLATRQAAGELPDVDVLSGYRGSGDEGTAMLELVADLAPGATLGFATAFSGKEAMAAVIPLLSNSGCNIIVDDLTYRSEAAFQEDVVGAAILNFVATSNFRMFFSSAGNSGHATNNHSGTWEGDFVLGSGAPASIGGGLIHNFGPASWNILNSAGFDVNLKWSDPIGGSSNDYDLYITNGAGNLLLGASTTTQSGTQDPLEYVVCNSSTCPAGARIYIKQYASAVTSTALRLDTRRGRLSVNTGGSTFGHNAPQYGVSVGAAHEQGRRFAAGDTIWNSSSDGWRRLFINRVPSKTPITAGCVLFSCGGGLTLFKPEIVAADSVTTTTPGFIPFTGTSAAAPHAAAIAALLKERAPLMTASEILTRMKNTAIDVMATGVDPDSGWGIVMADSAVFGATRNFAHDLNSDGKSDILWRNTSGEVGMWAMDGGSIASTRTIGTLPNNWSIVGQRDFGDDRATDIVWRSSAGDVLVWYLNGGVGSLSGAVSFGNVGTAWSVVGTGDFDGDGKGDILWRNSSGEVGIWFMNYTSIGSTFSFGIVPSNWFVMGTADFDGDGKSDILWRNTAHDVGIWLMNGKTIKSSPLLGNVGPNWSVVGLGDFNGDRKGDILWRSTSGEAGIWFMDGSYAAAVSLGIVPTIWSVASVGDYNGDGKSDILWRNTSSDVGIWFMKGATTLSTAGLGNVGPNWIVQNAASN